MTLIPAGIGTQEVINTLGLAALTGVSFLLKQLLHSNKRIIAQMLGSEPDTENSTLRDLITEGQKRHEDFARELGQFGEALATNRDEVRQAFSSIDRRIGSLDDRFQGLDVRVSRLESPEKPVRRPRAN